jgi:hypothetical protein
MMDHAILTEDEAAARVGRSTRTIRRWRARGVLTASPFGHYRESEVLEADRWMRQRRGHPPNLPVEVDSARDALDSLGYVPPISLTGARLLGVRDRLLGAVDALTRMASEIDAQTADLANVQSVQQRVYAVADGKIGPG